jgi:YfiR/HmsC-like
MLFAFTPSMHAMDKASADSLQAAIRTLSFLESLPKEGVIVVGVVYPSDIPNAQVLAVETAKSITYMRGPNSRPLQAIALSTVELEKFLGHLDVIFLMPGASKHSEVILDAMRRHHLMSISGDPACADAGCCVLMVSSGQRVEISLNTALAEAVGARFSLVFTMVVKRR